MKKTAALATIALLTALGAGYTAPQSGQDLFQKALVQERTEGNLQQAIQLYQRIVREFSDDHPLAAKALLQMGECYEKLGKEGARKAYERVVRDYPDQSQAAEQARIRLAALRKAAVKETAMATRKVWAGPGVDVQGSVSADGRYLSFNDGATGDLAIHDLETGKNRRLTNKGSWQKSRAWPDSATWSPDGKQLAYGWYDGDLCVDLDVIAREGGNPRLLRHCGSDESWMETDDWSPDGKQILIFVWDFEGGTQLLLVSAADGATRVLKTLQGSGDWPQAARFSRDGQYVAYDWPQEKDSAEHDVFLLSVDGGHETRLVQHPADERLLGWSPDGRGILFSSDRSGSVDMWFLPVTRGKAQGTPELVKSGVERIRPLGFTRDGSFYYGQAQPGCDVYITRMDPQSGRILAPSEKLITRFQGKNSWPAYSPDGKSLAYTTSRGHSLWSVNFPNIVVIHSLETGQEREFATKFQRLFKLRWPLDGRFIYLGAQGMGYYRLDTQTGEFTRILRRESPSTFFLDFDVSPDGKVLIYERVDTRGHEKGKILSRDLATGEEKQLLEVNDIDHFSISPDSRWLALLDYPKEKVLRVMPLGGGEPKELLRFEEDRNFHSQVAWTADGKHIFFQRNEPAAPGETSRRPVWWWIPAQGGEPQKLTLGISGILLGLSAHPDGQRIAAFGYSRGPAPESPAVWVMENFLPTVNGSKQASR